MVLAYDPRPAVWAGRMDRRKAASFREHTIGDWPFGTFRCRHRRGRAHMGLGRPNPEIDPESCRGSICAGRGTQGTQSWCTRPGRKGLTATCFRPGDLLGKNPKSRRGPISDLQGMKIYGLLLVRRPARRKPRGRRSVWRGDPSLLEPRRGGGAHHRSSALL